MLNAKIQIPAKHHDEYLKAFLRAKPVPLSGPGQPLFSAEEWFQQYFVLAARKIFHDGNALLASDAIEIPPDLIETQ